MQLPKYKPINKRLLKYCKYNGCGKEFVGRPIQKYCEFHTDPHHRKRIRARPENPNVKNQVFMHTFKDTTKAEFTCALDGCHRKFALDIFPRQYIYPKYCEEHRNEFKRERFERQSRFNLAEEA